MIPLADNAGIRARVAAATGVLFFVFKYWQMSLSLHSHSLSNTSHLMRVQEMRKQSVRLRSYHCKYIKTPTEEHYGVLNNHIQQPVEIVILFSDMEVCSDHNDT